MAESGTLRDVQIRYARADEFPAIVDLDGANFGIGYTDADLDEARLDVDLDRMLVAVDDAGGDDDHVVAVSCEVPFRMTLPGGDEVDATGLTWVSVDVTHRRRGLLRQLVERQIRGCSTKAVILNASEGWIYGRYGFGAATVVRSTVVDRRRSVLRAAPFSGEVRRLSSERARDVLPPIYDRWRRATPGALDRGAQRWQLQLLDGARHREGGSALQHLVHPDGYASYRVHPDWNRGRPRHTCRIVDYAVCTADAHTALWQALLGLELCATVESFRIPVDDPLPLRLTDGRSVRTVDLDDGLWVRPVDVAGLLAARTYAVAVDVVLEVLDPLLGDQAYRIVGGPGGARCHATADAPDVVMEVAVLGAVLLGGARLATYAAAGQVRGDPGVVSHLDRALLADRAPEYGTHF